MTKDPTLIQLSSKKQKRRGNAEKVLKEIMAEIPNLAKAHRSKKLNEHQRINSKEIHAKIHHN